jgi:hypothetical protein
LQLLPEVNGVPFMYWRPAGLLFGRFADASDFIEVHEVP